MPLAFINDTNGSMFRDKRRMQRTVSFNLLRLLRVNRDLKQYYEKRTSTISFYINQTIASAFVYNELAEGDEKKEVEMDSIIYIS